MNSHWLVHCMKQQIFLERAANSFYTLSHRIVQNTFDIDAPRKSNQMGLQNKQKIWEMFLLSFFFFFFFFFVQFLKTWRNQVLMVHFKEELLRARVDRHRFFFVKMTKKFLPPWDSNHRLYRLWLFVIFH